MLENSKETEMNKSVAPRNVENNPEKTFLGFSYFGKILGKTQNQTSINFFQGKKYGQILKQNAFFIYAAFFVEFHCKLYAVTYKLLHFT